MSGASLTDDSDRALRAPRGGVALTHRSPPCSTISTLHSNPSSPSCCSGVPGKVAGL